MRKIPTFFTGLTLLPGIMLAWVNATAQTTDTTEAEAPAAATPEAFSPDAQQAATVAEVIIKVNEAANYLHDRGQAGFSDFNNNARWVWKDSYVFVFSCRDNRMIAHPLRPDLVGKPIMQMEDEHGNMFFENLCEAGEGNDGGWVEYWWPRPGEGKASRKVSFTRSTEVSFQPDVRVGAGVYDDEMSVEELNQLSEHSTAPTRYAP